jgi:Viral BACON domain
MSKISRSLVLLCLGAACLAASACGGSSASGNLGGEKSVLALSKSTVMFAGIEGSSANPASASVDLTNTGTGALSFITASDSPWLAVTPSNGIAPQTLQISATIGSLTPNTYTGHILVTAAGAQGSPASVTITFTIGATAASTSPFWQQWGSNPQHTGMVPVAGQNLTSTLANVVYDPFVNQEKAENTAVFGEAVLTVHEQAPITDGNDVYMVMKSGSYDSCNPVGDWVNGTACGPNAWNTMVWNETRFSWVNGAFVTAWTFASDWKPEPNASNFNGGEPGLEGWEPVFHPVDVTNFIYVPGAAGTVWKVNKTTGMSASHINPFNANGNVNAMNTFVSGPLSTDSAGNIYYNVIELNTNGDPWGGNDVANSWLVKIAPDDSTLTATYASLVPGAPGGTATNCPGTFFSDASNPPFPWPPSPTAVAPAFPGPCGSQRPGVNIAPAIAANGTIYTASRAHFDSMAAYLIAVNPDLSPAWHASLQNRLTDGCGVLLPIAASGVTNEPNSCLNGTTVGVDPTTNAAGSAVIIDLASSSPTVLPDGSVVFGTLDNYNYSRGHLFRFDSQGNYVGAFGFGWDSTPGIYVHDSTFSVVIKDNHYPATAYCSSSSPVCSATSPGPYYITQLDANFNTEWSFQSTTIDSAHPNGYEWCINMPAIDMDGNVYVNSEDGNAYELPQGSSGVFTVPTGKIFLDSAIGAAYTPISVGPDGTIYTQNNGQLFVIGN